MTTTHVPPRARPRARSEHDLAVPAAKIAEVYEDRWRSEWRLTKLEPYTTGAQAWYAASWRRSLRSQFAVFETTLDEVRHRHARLLPWGWRLTMLRAYGTPEVGEVRWAAVWEPGQHPQIVVCDATAEAFRDRSHRLATAGWRICDQSERASRRTGSRYTAIWSNELKLAG